MLTLAQTQRDFAAAVLDAGLPPPAFVEKGRDEVRRLERFNIYRNNVVVGLIDLIEARFPVASQLVGSQFFRAMARVYVDQQRSGRSLLWYGTTFASFLETFQPVADTPYLADVARIEWACHEACYAPDATPLSASEFAIRQPAADACLRLHPSARVVASPFPVHDIWRANALGHAPSSLELTDQDQAVIITRPGDVVLVRRIETGAAIFFNDLKSGASLGGAFERAIAVAPDFSVQRALSDALAAGAFLEIVTEPSKIYTQMEPAA